MRNEEDYLLRVIRQVMAVLAAAAGKRRQGGDEAALTIVREGIGDLGYDVDLLYLLGVDGLIRLASERGQLEALGLLLVEESRLYPAAAPHGAKASRMGLALLAAAKERGVLSTDAAQEILATHGR
jgi:hypothetical protein